MNKLEVVSPLGIEIVKASDGAKRINKLDGKTIGEVWNGVFKGDLTFPAIRKLLVAKYPGLRIVPYTEFPHAPHSDDPARQRELAQQIVAQAEARGCDALISGNGA